LEFKIKHHYRITEKVLHLINKDLILTYRKNIPNIVPYENHIFREDCMNGSIVLRKDVVQPRWIVSWYWKKKTYKISRYRGHLMYQTHPTNKDKDRGYQTARKLLGLMQAAVEKGRFRIERYTNDGWTDIPEFCQKWMDDCIIPARKPDTVKKYRGFLNKWILPFFENKDLVLQEIELDTLHELVTYITKTKKQTALTNVPKIEMVRTIYEKEPSQNAAQIRQGVIEEFDVAISPSYMRRMVSEIKNGAKKIEVPADEKNFAKHTYDVLNAMHGIMDYAFRCKKIIAVPPFPKKETYDFKPKKFDYLSPEDFNKVFSLLAPVDKPIFLWLKLHFRRPGEACALHKSDYDQINQVFTVHRAISNRQLVDSVKTNWASPKSHVVLCDEEFTPIANRLMGENPDSPFLFVNPRARNKGQRYSIGSIERVWYKACDEAGVRRIWPYQGTKHTACMEFLANGGSEDELMIETDHATRASVKAYIEMTLERKKKARSAAKKRKEENRKLEEKKAQAGKIINLFGDRSGTR